MITYKELQLTISKKTYQNFYLLISKDYYRIRKVLNLFKNLIENQDLNYTNIDLGSIDDFKEVENLANTYPLSDKLRIIVINNIDMEKHKAHLAKLAKYLPQISPTTILIMTIYVKDHRDTYKNNSLVKKLEKINPCSVVYQPKITIQDLKEIITEENVNLPQMAINALLNSDNLDIARNDIIKLSLLENLDEAKIKRNLSTSNEIDVFNLTEAIQHKNLEKALLYINTIKDNGETDIKINILIMRSFKLLYDCKRYISQNISQPVMATKLGMHPYPIKLACEQCGKFELKTLEKAIEYCLEFEIDFKKGVLGSLELLLVKILALS